MNNQGNHSHWRAPKTHLLQCCKEVLLVVKNVGWKEDRCAGYADKVIDVNQLGGDVSEGEEADHDFVPRRGSWVEARSSDHPKSHLGAPGQVVVGEHHPFVARGVHQAAALVDRNLGQTLLQSVWLERTTKLKKAFPGEDVLLVALGQSSLVRERGLSSPLDDTLQLRQLVLHQQHLLEQGLALNDDDVGLAVDADPRHLLSVQALVQSGGNPPVSRCRIRRARKIKPTEIGIKARHLA